jgi:hypothetical protein
VRAYFYGPIPVVVMQRAADRTHLALDKDSPATRPVLPPGCGQVIARPRVGGLHRRYDRRAA